MAGGIIVRKYFKRDGHIYYVIKGEGSEKIPTTIFFLDFYDELSQYATWDGIFFIRDASKTSGGHEGDPTVKSGWAMYTWDPAKEKLEKTQNPGWRKIAEQESLDLDETKFVSLVHFNKVIYGDGVEDLGLLGRIIACEEKVGECVRIVESVDARIVDLEKYKHWHTNKVDVLDQLIYRNDRLEFRGVPIGGNTMLYDNVRDGKICWINPNDPTACFPVKNSRTIADLIKTSDLDWIGMKVVVVEANGDLTTYQFVEDPTNPGVKHEMTGVEQIKSNRTYSAVDIATGEELDNISDEDALVKFMDEEKKWKVYYREKATVVRFLYTITKSSRGQITYVDELPKCDVSYLDRGLWSAFTSTDTVVAGHFYEAIEDESVEGGARWSDVTISGSHALDDVDGAQFLPGCYCIMEPEMPYKKYKLFWKEPEDIEGRFAFGHTKLVRKFGSAPTSVDDGTVVATLSSHDMRYNMYVDTCPFSNQSVFYRLFTFSNAGVQLKAMDPIEPEFLEWKTIIDAKGTYALDHMFVVGDHVVLPEHPRFGFVDTEVVDVDSNNLVLRTTVRNDRWTEPMLRDYTRYKLTVDDFPEPSKTYKVFGDDGFVDWSGGFFPSDVSIYELDDMYPNGIFGNFEINDGLVTFTLI